MPKTQTKPNRFRRLLSWCARHKISAVFSALLLVGVLYFVISGIVWDLQVRAEKNRYVATSQAMQKLREVFRTGTSRSFQYCAYTSSGAVFAAKHINCDTGVKAIYEGLPKQQAVSTIEELKNTLASEFGGIRQNQKGYEASDLAVYDFTANSLECLFVASYFEQPPTTPPFILGSISSAKSSTYVEIDCGGAANAEHFPVVKD